MTPEDFYQSQILRYQTSCFKEDDIPTEDTIRKILSESLTSIPVFGNDWHHSVSVYGPEYKKDKEKLVLQTVEDNHYRKTFDTRKLGRPGIATSLTPICRTFKNKAKSGWYKNRGFEDDVSFNLQVTAPYLLAFRFSPDSYVHKDKGEMAKDKKSKGLNSAMTHAYAITIIAQHYGIQAGFCGCFIFNDENVNRIWYNDPDIILFVGLGYQEDWCFESVGSLHYKERQQSKPEFSDIVKWNT